MRKLILIIGAVFWTIFGLRVAADDRVFSALTIEEGLSANHVRAIVTDHLGYIWLGTLEGLDRYDGDEVRHFSTGFPSNTTVNCLLEDSLFRLWIGTERGLYVKRPDRTGIYPVDSGNLPMRILSLTALPSGRVGMGTDRGFFRFDPIRDEVIQCYPAIGSQGGSVTGAVFDSDSLLWLATEQGLVALGRSDSEKPAYRIVEESRGMALTAIVCIGDSLCIGTADKGLFWYVPSSDRLAPVEGLYNPIILCLQSAPDGILYAGTNGGGILQINPQTGTMVTFTHRPGESGSLRSNAIYALSVSSDGNLWAGTFSAGASFSPRQNLLFRQFTLPDGNRLPNPNIRSFWFDPEGAMLLGTRDGLYSLSKKSKAPRFFAPAPYREGAPAGSIVLKIGRYHGDILVSTFGGGLQRFDPLSGLFSPFEAIPSHRSPSLYDFVTDEKGNLWLAGLDGLYQFRPETGAISHFTAENSPLLCNSLYALRLDSSNRLWVGSRDGVSLYRVTENKLEPVPLPEAPENHRKVNYIFEDSRKRVWVCTEIGGLFLYEADLSAVHRFTEADGLPSNSVCAIAGGAAGQFWISTLKGFCRFYLERNRFDLFGMPEGIPGPAFSPAAVFSALDGALWFGNEEGLLYFYPDSIPDSRPSGPVRITDIFLSGTSLPWGEGSVLNAPPEEVRSLTLRQDQNDIGFRFLQLTYQPQTEARLEFRLEGVDTTWRQASSPYTVFYSQLKPGKYNFAVRNAFSDPGEELRSINLVIRRNGLRSPWLWFSLLIAMVAAVWRAYLHYRRQRRELARLSRNPNPRGQYLTSRLETTRSDEIARAIQEALQREKPFLDPDFSLGRLASLTGYSLHELSQVINLQLQQSFTDLINHYRIEELKLRLAGPDREKLTIMALAEQCGFRSKSAFYRSFKKEMGVTPAEYLKKQ